MQGVATVINIAIQLASGSLIDPIPQSIDDCFFGLRLIIEFSGKDDNVSLEEASILDSDWELIEDESNRLKKEILEMVEDRNTDYRASIKQALDIRADRNEYYTISVL